MTILAGDFSGRSLSSFAWITGHQGLAKDVETGLVYNRARYLDTSMGRFTIRDPLGYVDGMSLICYTSGNPGRRTDPRGLYWVERWLQEADLKWDPGAAEIPPEAIFHWKTWYSNIHKFNLLIEAHCNGQNVIIDNAEAGDMRIDTMGGGYGHFDNAKGSLLQTDFTNSGCGCKRFIWSISAAEGASQWIVLPLAAAGTIAGDLLGEIIGNGLVPGGGKVGGRIGAPVGGAIGSGIGLWLGGAFGGFGVYQIDVCCSKNGSPEYTFTTIQEGVYGDDELRWHDDDWPV